jgi:hypothetical protein
MLYQAAEAGTSAEAACAFTMNSVGDEELAVLEVFLGKPGIVDDLIHGHAPLSQYRAWVEHFVKLMNADIKDAMAPESVDDGPHPEVAPAPDSLPATPVKENVVEAVVIPPDKEGNL